MFLYEWMNEWTNKLESIRNWVNQTETCEITCNLQQHIQNAVLFLKSPMLQSDTIEGSNIPLKKSLQGWFS